MFVVSCAVRAQGAQDGGVTDAALPADAGQLVPEIATLRSLYAGTPDTWPKAAVDPGVEFVEFGLLPARTELDDHSRAMALLGATLFAERRLSGSGQISCMSCHNRELGFGDGLKTAFGHDRKRGNRNSPSLFTVGLLDKLMWDGRSNSLEDQVHNPITNPIEMAGNIEDIERWINQDPEYQKRFAEVFGEGRIGFGQIAQALAAFQRTLRPPTTRWDAVLAQGGKLLNDEQLLGLHLFRTKARCANCHHGPLLSDQKFHSLAISFYDRQLEDVGRYSVTGDPKDVGAFRTPSLRAVRRTGPYMHNGIFPELRGLINLYAFGGGRDRTAQSKTTNAPPPVHNPLLTKLELTNEERDALVTFLMML
ncbi:MAG: cytochrome-c peroxidase [Sphingomonadales bacterium]|nr:cytochrome-c peroxidase [Sphingomonadales bacterium]MBK9002676.1 cytochrome-c peroxidase [Sphingomonadales bacterium]MBK9267898.1 cytochrome-c peroxidase [Sphingomonadales bacterium]